MLNSSEANTLLAGERYIKLVDSIKPSLNSVKNFISTEIKEDKWLNYDELITSASDEEVYTEIS